MDNLLYLRIVLIVLFVLKYSINKYQLVCIWDIFVFRIYFVPNL